MKKEERVGEEFGDFVLIKYKGKNKNNLPLYDCQCKNCKNILYDKDYYNIKHGTLKICKVCKKNNKNMELNSMMVGHKFGRLIPLKRYYDDSGIIKWECICDCGNLEHYIASYYSLLYGTTRSCGCLIKENNKKMFSKTNIYDLSQNFGIGMASNTDKEFYFDLEDYELIKNYCWHESNDGYIRAYDPTAESKYVNFHRLVMNPSSDEIVDHINHLTNDNRKENLRISDYSKNQMNRELTKNNTTGITGVSYCEKTQDYVAFIGLNGKNKFLGRSKDIDKVIKIRKEAEKIYYKENSYDNSQNISTYIKENS